MSVTKLNVVKKYYNTEKEKSLCIKMGGSCRFRSKFMGWFGGLKTSEERRSDIIAMKEIIPYYIGMELEKKDRKKKTDNNNKKRKKKKKKTMKTKKTETRKKKKK